MVSKLCFNGAAAPIAIPSWAFFLLPSHPDRGADNGLRNSD
ncbi:hypothetical protein [Fluoribacter dumoffii]|nr:hypothetical protein [Fluoribacter dumoffii]